MITSRFPFWRTNPAGFAVTGYWPILTGCLAVLVIPPLLGLIVLGISQASVPNGADATQITTQEYIASIAFILSGSPLFSWIALIVAVPVSGGLMRTGYAGWGVAAMMGGLIGALIGAVLAGEFTPSSDVDLFTGCGILFALIYWGAIRVIHPTAFGVSFKAAP